MKLTFREQFCYDKFRARGMDEDEANLLARLKCIFNEFIEKNPEVRDNMAKELRKKEGFFYQFCIDSGRFTSDEIDRIYRIFNNPS